MSNRGNTAKATAIGLVLSVFCIVAAYAQHPAPNPRPGDPTITMSPDGSTTYVITPEGHLPSVDPFANPPGANHLDNVDQNMVDSNGVEIPHSLPSRPHSPYNLHPDPVVTEINPISPTDDLKTIIATLRKGIQRRYRLNRRAINFAIDILEGNPIKNRAYSGFALLHYTGGERQKKVKPVRNNRGKLIGGTVNIHQVLYDTHYESDTMFLDVSEVLNVPYTITYTIDVLNRGHEDFAPFAMFFDAPEDGATLGKKPHFGIDQTFFPVEDGTRNVFKISMPPGKYYKLTYHWGWRIHPPRIQATENALQKIGDKFLVELEEDVFGVNPRATEESRIAAISMIGNRAPAKRMWNGFRKLLGQASGNPYVDGHGASSAGNVIDEIESAFHDWKDRTKLPAGFEPDPDAHMTIVFLNNTLYGQMKGKVYSGEDDLPQFSKRPFDFHVKVYNGDYFLHAYTNVDFGGRRGWENQFYSTVDVGGAGPWFTFGRIHWWPNVGGIQIPPANPATDKPGQHDIKITYNFEPSRRLRIYQFDPLHHDVAIWSIH